MQNQPPAKSNVTKACYLRNSWYYMLGIIYEKSHEKNKPFKKLYISIGGVGQIEVRAQLR